MQSFIAGFSGLASSGKGGTKAIAEQIPGARHFPHPLGLGNERKYAEEIAQAKPDFIALFGHSEGADLVLQIAEELAKLHIVVDYIGIIDMTYLASGEAGANIKVLQEFYAQYAKTEFLDSFQGDHQFFDLDELEGRNIGHSGAARLEFTHNTIIETINSLQTKDIAMVEYKLTPRIALEVAAHEGLVQEAYKDSVGIWTWSIGITDFSGHKVRRYIDNPADIDRCIEVYIWLLDTRYLPAVQRAFQGRELTESQLAAALSFHWNTGSIEKASWVKSWLAGNISEAKRKFMLWRKPPEIIKRREREMNLFFDGRWHGDGTVTHYPLVHTGGRLNFSQTKRLDISQEVTQAIEEHYGTPSPVIIPDTPEPAPATVISSLQEFEAYIRQHIPDVDKTALDLMKIRQLMSPEQPQSTPSISPVIAPDFSLPETKESKMTFNFLNFKSKTFWVGAAMVIAGILQFVAPGSPLTEIVLSFYPDVDPGLLLTNGLVVIFGREALEKIK
ncbi:MAG: hypothetical protein AAFW66_03095 [Pseudomonadota bacterium]